MLDVALFEPEIAPNTGNIIRLCANNGFHLHLIEPLGFDFEEKKLRRAGLDYCDLEKLTRHKNYDSFLEFVGKRRIFACTTKGSSSYTTINYQKGDVLLFGPETRGLPSSILDDIALHERIRIPMQPNSRSLNLSNSVAIISYEAWRQLGFDGGQ